MQTDCLNVTKLFKCSFTFCQLLTTEHGGIFFWILTCTFIFLINKSALSHTSRFFFRSSNDVDRSFDLYIK